MINHLLILLTLSVHIDSISHHHGHYDHGHHGYGGQNYGGYPRGAYSSGGGFNGRCFSGDSLIKLTNGEHKQISSLQSGDEIMTIDQSRIISTEMMFMLDKQISYEALFYTLKTESGHQISLTEHHLIPIRSANESFNYLFAKQIQIGDFLYVLLNNQIDTSRVINITIERKQGYYAPLTMEGTLLVNQVLASCFASVKDHHLAQLSMFPLRFYYQLVRSLSLNDPFDTDKSVGVPQIVSVMFRLARYFIPQTFSSP